MDIARLVLEYVRAILSPQMIAGLVVVALLVLFTSDLKRLLARVAKLRFPGGSEVTLQIERSLTERAGLNVHDPAAAPALPENPTRDQVDNTIGAYQAVARMWEFRYLGYFLAHDTQWALDWIAGASGATVGVLDLLYAAPERDAILDALRKHGLIEQRGDSLKVSDKGRGYITFRGPLRPPLGAGS